MLRLEFDRAKKHDKKLEMTYVTSRIIDPFQSELFVSKSEGNTINPKVLRVDNVDFACTTANRCLEIFEVARVTAA